MEWEYNNSRVKVVEMDKQVVGVGPYVGDFENEILTFRPYTAWLTSALETDNIFVQTHSNRTFLYNFLPRENIFEIYEHLTRDELSQKGYIHNLLERKEFGLIKKEFINKISEITKSFKRDIAIYHLKYSGSVTPYSVHKKIFLPIEVPSIEGDFKDKLVFVPGIEEEEEKLEKILDFLQRYDDLVVIGDMKSYFPNENRLLKYIDYTKNCYRYLVRYITEARAVVCPLGYWTFLCNCQRTPVFSWGRYVSPYREEGLYHLGNTKSIVIPSSKSTDVSIIIRSIEVFLESYG